MCNNSPSSGPCDAADCSGDASRRLASVVPGEAMYGAAEGLGGLDL